MLAVSKRCLIDADRIPGRDRERPQEAVEVAGTSEGRALD
jgi:hypothetical protein